ncbi:MAG: FMN-binding negative transcriptional regulator [Vitreoscilla sp.]|nr:FMN-binding negative transcriptional regulator [Vitreoscilla sp.]
MYIRKQHQLPDPERVLALVQAHPLGAWVCQTEGGLVANHLPFFLDRGQGEQGTLVGHVSRANPVWRQLGSGAPSVVMFGGPQAYITPSWYPGKVAHGKVVPTWNYAVAHVHGQARAMDDPAWLTAMLRQLTHAQEGARPQPWQLGDAPADYIAQLARGIVGIAIPVERLEGKLKASQDEDLADRHGTVQGLRSDALHGSLAMAQLVQRALDDEGASPQT